MARPRCLDRSTRPARAATARAATARPATARPATARPAIAGAVIAAVIGAFVALFVLLGPASPVLAHAELESTSPDAGSIVDDAPTRIVLTFSEPVDEIGDSIHLVTATGVDIVLELTGHSLGGSTLSADVPPLEDGTYVVAWRAVSSDSHAISGAFTFSVGVQTTTDDGLIDRLVEQDSASSPTQVWLGIGRWASFAGIALLVGALGMLGRCAPDALLRRRTTPALAVAAGAAVLGTAVMIGAQSEVIGNGAFDPSGWRAVADTRAGLWWVVRLAICVVALVLVRLRLHRRRGPDGFGAVHTATFLLGATGLLAVVAAGGHGVTGRAPAAGFLATWVHLAAMCGWAGGLVALAVLVRREQVRVAATRFSPIAFGSVVALALTGTANAWRQSDSWTALRDSSYGGWLLVKLVVITGVVAVAGVSRWLVANSIEGPDSDRAVHRAVRVEVLGMIVVLVATAGLVSSPPPRTAVPGPLTVSAVQDDRIAQIVLDPPVSGGAVMHVYVTSTNGTLAQPISITVTASLPDRGIAALGLTLEREGPGHLTSDDVDLPIAGTWTFTIEVRYSEFDQERFVLEADVS